MTDLGLTGAGLGHLAALTALVLAGAVAARGRCTAACGLFAAGMVLLAADASLGALAAGAGVTPEGLRWLRW